MVGPWPRSAMAARWLSLLLLLGLAGVVLRVHGQDDNLGFISIDCGLPVSASGYVDNATKLSFVSDAGFIDAGTNYNMSAEYITPSMGRGWHTVRSFAGASARNCYTLRSLVSELKYLIRATFIYDNYDGLNRAPVIDLHVGVNYWTTVNTLYNTRAYYGFHQYSVSLNSTDNSTLPPVLNAIEIFSVVPTTSVPTAAQDVSDITAIRGKYHVKKNWMGDPCVPKSFA